MAVRKRLGLDDPAIRPFVAEFSETFWPAYPRRVAPRAALQAYVSARRRGITLEQLMEGLTNFKADLLVHQRGREFIPHASTWLNQDRYLDEYEINMPSSSKSLLEKLKDQTEH